MDSAGDTPKGWVAPFGDPRINSCSHFPSAFRSVPRPSSPLGAKASTRCPYFALAHAQPQARQEARLVPMRKHRSADADASAFAYPCPDPARRTGRTRFTVSRLASRCQKSREQRTENRPDAAVRALCKLEEAGVRGRRSTLPPFLTVRGPDQTARNQDPPAGPNAAGFLSFVVLRPRSSDLRLSGGPGPT
jgi:hypothetical protein